MDIETEFTALTLMEFEAEWSLHGRRPERAPKIVVGVDGSVASVAALRWSAEEARRRGARLFVVVAYRHDPTLQPPLGTDAWSRQPEEPTSSSWGTKRTAR